MKMLTMRRRSLFVVGKQLALVLAVAAVYYGLAKVGLSLAFAHPKVSPVWPPAGFALAAVILLGYRVWPGIALGDFVGSIQTGVSVAAACGIALGNTLEALVGAYLLNRFTSARDLLDRAQDIFRFVAYAAIFSTAISATIGTTAICLEGFADWSDYKSLWLTWWLGDAVGNLVVAPLLLAWARKPEIKDPLQVAEALLLFALLFVISQEVFGGWLLGGAGNYPLEHLTIPFLVWAAVRFGPRGAASSVFILSAIAIQGTIMGYGPFRRETENESLLLLQVFIGAVAATALVLAAAVTERRRAREQLRASLEEKEVMLKEIHHRVKNNLQVISSLLNLQSRYMEAKPPQEILRESRDRIRSMALIHDKLYRSKNLSRIDFAEYVRSLAADLFRSYGVNGNTVQLRVNIQDVLINVDAATTCGLIINELVSNSLKHAFPAGRKGEITIDLCSESDGKLRLSIADNGIGLPRGFDFKNTESLGLKLVRILTDQLRGSVELDSSSGAQFNIVFTIPGYYSKEVEENGKRTDSLG